MKSSTVVVPGRSEFLRSLMQGILLGACLVSLLLAWKWEQVRTAAPPRSPPVVVQSPATDPAQLSRQHSSPGRLPDFGQEKPSQDVRHIANWSFVTGDHAGKAVVILDKREAKVYTLEPGGRLVASTPVLLGSAIGDRAIPGIGDKPLKDIRAEEKTTHAGRFVAEPGFNTDGEDVIWVDYGAALSMHRVRANNASERRLERLASPMQEDNRISYGCINVPVSFYERVLSPLVRKTGAVIYVLPETRTVQEVFGSWDVTDLRAREAIAGARTQSVTQ